MDGQLKSITGSATFPVRYEYGVALDDGTNRFYTKEIKLHAAGSDSSEWITNYTDAVGRQYKTTFAAASGPFPYRQSFYNNVGQLIRERDPDGVTTLYEYNAEGGRETSAISTNQSTTINFSGDRITKTISDVTTIGGVDVVRSRTYQWFTNGSTISNLVAETRRSADGKTSWDIRFGLTNLITTHYPGSGYTVVTNTAPDGSFTIHTNYQGQLLSTTRKDANGSQLGRTTFTYDSHGRLRYETDARNGATTTYFNNADLISSVTTPAPGTGEAPQTTTYNYDKLGRMTNSVLPDGGSVTNEHLVNGLVRLTNGSRPTRHSSLGSWDHNPLHQQCDGRHRWHRVLG
jgi:YD repeat-containing protein